MDLRSRQVRRTLRHVLMLLAVCCLTLTPAAAAQAPATPDLSGKWQKQGFGFQPPYVNEAEEVIDGLKNPILKPWTAEVLIEKQWVFNHGRLYPVPHDSCWPDGVPGVLGLRDMQILQTPREITIIFRNDNQVRHIYLDQPRSQPLQRSWYGESVGHFEGDTLVVDTIGFYARPQATIDRQGTPVTEALHVVERYRLLDGGEKLEIGFTVEDPNVFRKPWSLTVTFTPRGDIQEEICAENNRDWADLVPIADLPDF
jgi:hypothetical protein